MIALFRINQTTKKLLWNSKKSDQWHQSPKMRITNFTIYYLYQSSAKFSVIRPNLQMKANGLISRLRHFSPKSILLKFYNSFFKSRLRYACQILAKNLLTFSNFHASSSPIFADLRILKLSDLVKLLNIICSYQFCTSNQALMHNLNYSDSHNTRVSVLGLLARA